MGFIGHFTYDKTLQEWLEWFLLIHDDLLA